MTEVEDIFATLFKNAKETPRERLLRIHPNFDSYPDYLQSALLKNEKLQDRV